MTIASQTRTAGPFTGTGLLVSYPFAFKIFQAADLLIQQTDTSGNLTQWTLGGNYTVVLNADQNVSPGGTITPLVALPAGYVLNVTSAVALTQGASLTNAGGFFPKTIEDALDRLTILIQQGLGSFGSTIRVPDIGGVPALPGPAGRANTFLGFDVNGALVTVTTAVGSAATLALQYAGSTGSSFIGFIHSFGGSIARTMQDKARDQVSTLDFVGIDITGAADSRAALNTMFAATSNTGDKRTVTIRKGTYKVSGQLSVGSNIHVVFEPGVTFNTTLDVNTALFVIAGQQDVTFEGRYCILNGNKAGVTPTDGGGQTGFLIYGSKNVRIQGFIILNFAFDGITLTGDPSVPGPSAPCKNVALIDNYISGCGRNNISVIHAEGYSIQGGYYGEAAGTPSGPWAGIDIEPNQHEHCTGGSIRGIVTANNAGPGVQFVPNQQSVDTGTNFDCSLKGWRSDNDGFAGAVTAGKAALLFAAGGGWSNQVYGQIACEDAVIVNPKYAGVGQKNWDADLAPGVLCRNIRVLNPDGTQNNPDNFGRSAFLIYQLAADLAAGGPALVGNMVFENCHAEDMRGSPRMPFGFWVESTGTTGVKRVRFRNPRSVNFAASFKADVNMNAALNGVITDVNVSYDSPILVAAIASTVIGQWLGKRWTSNGAGNTFTLPDVTKTLGAVYEGYFPAGATGNTVTAAAGQTIKVPGSAAALSHAPTANDCWRYWNPDGTHWVAAQVA